MTYQTFQNGATDNGVGIMIADTDQQRRDVMQWKVASTILAVVSFFAIALTGSGDVAAVVKMVSLPAGNVALQKDVPMEAVPKERTLQFLDSYGIWDRSSLSKGSADDDDDDDDNDDNEESGKDCKDRNALRDMPRELRNQIKGFRIAVPWSELQPTKEGDVNWEAMDCMLKKAMEYDDKYGKDDRLKYVYFQLLVGPDSPNWILKNDDELKLQIKEDYDAKDEIKIEGEVDVTNVYVLRKKQKEGKDAKNVKVYPYYPDAQYQAYLEAIVKKIADHIYGDDGAVDFDHKGNRFKVSKEWLERLVFIQVATGSTGDEAPYKGRPFFVLKPNGETITYRYNDVGDKIENIDYTVEETEENKYQLLRDTHKDWNAYREKVFTLFAEQFQHRRNKRIIPLLFNKMDPGMKADPAEKVEDQDPDFRFYNKTYDLIKKEVKYVGRKGSILPRGYNLNEMRSFISKSTPYPLDKEKIFVLTRAEMDQTWKRPFFNKYLGVNMYWSALNALHGGLSVWDLSYHVFYGPKDGEERDDGKDVFYDIDSILPAFEFFNKYARQVSPADADNAFIAFFRGLDTLDEENFPLETSDGVGAYPYDPRYKESGPIPLNFKRSNMGRYDAIIERFKKDGAKISDPDGLILGQVAQRGKGGLQDINDIGCDVPRENYSRFIKQVAANDFDVGKWRVDGPLSQSSPKESRFARGFDEENKAIYLKVDDQFLGKRDIFKISVTFYFEGKADFELCYVSGNDGLTTALQMSRDKKEKGEWKTVTSGRINDAVFDGSIKFTNKKGEEEEADLILRPLGKLKRHFDVFHMVEIEKVGD